MADGDEDTRLCRAFLEELGLGWMAPRFVAANLQGDLVEVVRRVRHSVSPRSPPPHLRQSEPVIPGSAVRERILQRGF